MAFGPSAQAVAHVRSYWDAQAFLGAEKDSRRICGDNTYVERRNPHNIAVRLHQTDIIAFSESGLITLTTGGWHSQITKQRLEQFLPAPLTVFSFNGQWRIGLNGQRWANSKEETTESVVFTDGLTLRRHDDGTWEPLNALTPEAEARLNAAKRSLDKKVKAYVAKLPEAVAKWSAELRETQQLKSSGDPWCCLMGIGADGRDHLWTHLEDGYVFPTIVIRAYEDSGRYDGGPLSASQYAVNHIAFGLTKDIQREVTKYLRKKLDPFTSDDAAAIDPKSNAALERYVDIAKQALEHPSDYAYFGKDESLYKTSAPTFGRNRDSDNIEIANYEIVWETLCTEFPDLVATTELADAHAENPGGIYVHGASHWACGWVEQIVVPVLADTTKPLGPTNLHPAFVRVTELAEQTNVYPALGGAEERAEEMDHEQAVKDITQWQDFLADKGDPFVKAFDAETLYRYLEDGESAYNWYYEDSEPLVGVLTLHALACYADSLTQVDGQGVLL